MRRSKNSLVSVIITTRNEADVIGRLMESLKNQTYSDLEIIVVDNNSLDRTKSISFEYTKKVFDYGPERSAQRNFGAKIAKGEYYFFLDADMELTSNVVKECVELIQGDRRAGAATILEKSIAKTFWEKVKAFERSFYNLEGDNVTDAARFFPKEIFNKVGGYDETITGPEDWDITDNVKKLGYKIGLVKAIIYHHERIPSIVSLIRKKFYYGLKSHRYLSKQKVSTFSSKTIYFLRPVFYRDPLKLCMHPVLTLAMFFLLSAELVAGGFGFMIGKYKRI